MSLYLPKMSDTPGVTIPGLADNFGALEGSLVEYGENENGHYWRWENGLQICIGFFTVNISLDIQWLGGWYRSGIIQFYYPADFLPGAYSCNINTHVALFTPRPGTRVGGLGQSSTNFTLVHPVEITNAEIGISVVAQGRWK